MIIKSYSQALRLYNLSVDLANNWISRYYPSNNYKFFGVSIEKVQAFSQHHFFSCLCEKTPIENTWGQYPTSTELSQNRNFDLILKIIFRIFDLVKFLLSPKRSLDNLTACQILVLASGRHLDDLRSLLKNLRTEQQIMVVGKITPRTQNWLRRVKLNFLNVENGSHFVDRWQRLKFLALFARSFWVKNKNYHLLETADWRGRLWYLRLFQFPQIATLLTFAHNLFLKTKPKVILTTTSNDTFGAAFVLSAQALGIQVIELQHGIVSYETIESHYYQSDHYLVWGKIPKQLHPKNGQVVGCPYFEKPKIKIVNLPNYYKNKALRVLVLLSPPYGMLSIFKSKPNQEVLSDLIKGLSKLPSSYQIIFRSHPSFPLKQILKSSGLQLPVNFSINDNSDTLQEIKSSDVVISQATTAGLIAILLKKPSFFFDNSYLFEKFGEPFTNSESTVHVPLQSLRQIDQPVLNLLNDKQLLTKQRKAQDRFANDYCAKFGKDSWIAIEKFIEEIISGNRSWKK